MAVVSIEDLAFVACNDLFEQLTGARRSELFAQSLLSLAHPRHKARTQAAGALLLSSTTCAEPAIVADAFVWRLPQRGDVGVELCMSCIKAAVRGDIVLFHFLVLATEAPLAGEDIIVNAGDMADGRAEPQTQLTPGDCDGVNEYIS